MKNILSIFFYLYKALSGSTVDGLKIFVNDRVLMFEQIRLKFQGTACVRGLWHYNLQNLRDVSYDLQVNVVGES